MDSNPASYQYGLTAAGRDNVHASFVGMTQHERSRMFIALLRVLSRILMDVANAATSAMRELREENLEVDVETEVDETALMQQPDAARLANAARLQQASKKVDLGHLLGSEREKLCRSLLASLDRMQVEEARRCSQNFLCRLLRYYAVTGENAIHDLPPDAQELVAGMVAYGADLSAGELPGTGMDEYFVTHWWNLVSSTFSVPIESSGGPVPGVSSMAAGNPEMAHSGTHRGTSAPSASAFRENMETPATKIIELEDLVSTVAEQACASEELGDGAEVTGEEEVMCAPSGGEAPIAQGTEVPVALGTTIRDDTTDRRALMRACEELKAARYRDWEMWELQHAMDNVDCGGSHEVVLRGAVRHRHGGLGSTQSMLFRVREDERLELQIEGVRDRQVRKRPLVDVGTQSDEL